MDWSINLRQGCQTRSQSAHESGKISQLLHKKLKDDHGASDLLRATEGQELWRCRGVGDTSRWDDNVGIGKSALKSQALPGRTAGNGVFFGKDFAEGTIICPYEGKRVKPSEASDLAKTSRYIYQDRSGVTVDGDPDLSYGPSINDGVNYW